MWWISLKSCGKHITYIPLRTLPLASNIPVLRFLALSEAGLEVLFPECLFLCVLSHGELNVMNYSNSLPFLIILTLGKIQKSHSASYGAWVRWPRTSDTILALGSSGHCSFNHIFYFHIQTSLILNFKYKKYKKLFSRKKSVWYLMIWKMSK